MHANQIANSEVLQPKVSVVMPSYNNSAYIRSAIDSVLQQDYSNIELIVVDDGSSDDSVAILQSYGDQIRLICQPNAGPAAARNHGLRYVTGDFVAFHDSDDLWLPGKLSAQVAFLQQHPQYAACYSSWQVWDGGTVPEYTEQETGTPSGVAIDETGSGWLYLPLLKVSLLHTITVLIRRNVVNEVGFFSEEFRIGEDHHYWLRLARCGQIAKLAPIFALYRQNPTSTTNKVHLRNYSLEVLQAVIQTYGTYCPSGLSINKETINYYLGERHFTYAYQCFWSGRQDLAAPAFYQSFLLRFLPGRSWLYWLLSNNKYLYRIFRAVKS